IYNESKRFGFPMVIDGYFLPKSLPEIFEAKEQAQVPLLVGWNSAEIPGSAFTQGSYSKENYMAKVKETYPEQHAEVLKLYPGNSEKEIERSATDLASDRFIAYSTWKWFDLHRKNSEQPVYRYLYSKIRPALRDQNLASGLAGGTMVKNSEAAKIPEPIGAPHAAEIEYAMGNLHLVEDYAWTADDFKASETMLNYFANFVKTGNPNGENLAEWPKADSDDTMPPVMVIDTESSAINAENDARYLFLDKAYNKE
ncbi:MAG TPA: carboxylesterase family protein, partial [Pricia sp.]|nr:carboxylesterase family protein [Pricia sp.]